MKKFIQENKFILVLFALWVITGLTVILTTTKFELHLVFNQYHNLFFDQFFKYITYLGGGFGIILCLLFLIITKKPRKLILLVILFYGIGMGVVQLSKHVVLHHVKRPTAVAETKEVTLRTVEGVHLRKSKSFPSGHATEIFFSFGILVYINKKNWLKICLFLFAIIAAYSRVYLSQHFFEDIFTGSIVAFSLISAAFIIFYRGTFNESS